MPTQRPQKTPTECPPRGLSYEDRVDAGRDKPFLARWREGGLKKSKAFPSAKDREEFAASWLAQRRAHGKLATLVTADERATWDEFAKLTGGAPVLEVARFWAKHRGKLDGALSLKDAITRYVAAQEGRKLSRDTVTHRDLHLKRLRESLGDGKSIGEITTDALRKWLAGLGMSAYSQKHHRANAHKLFDWLVMERLLDRNPVTPIPVPEEDSGEINLLTVEQARKLFAVNRRHRSIGRLALEAFAGLRTSSAARLVLADIKFDQLGIELPGDKHKTKRRHYIDGLPANLWAWLKRAPKSGWKVLPRVYTDDKRAMFEAAGLKGGEADDEAMRNALRHSFASYHVAAFRDPGKTALILTHRNQQMLWRHYKGRASEADGKAYFEIAS